MNNFLRRIEAIEQRLQATSERVRKKNALVFYNRKSQYFDANGNEITPDDTQVIVLLPVKDKR